METSIYFKCLKCGRNLKTPETRKRGYGSICWQQIKGEMLKKDNLLTNLNKNDKE